MVGGDASSFSFRFMTAASRSFLFPSSFGDGNSWCAEILVGNSCRPPRRSTVLGVDVEVLGSKRGSCKGLLPCGDPGEVRNFGDEIRGGVFQRRLNPCNQTEFRMSLFIKAKITYMSLFLVHRASISLNFHFGTQRVEAEILFEFVW